MPRTQPNPNRALTSGIDSHGTRLSALENQQYLVFTDPNNVSGAWPQGIPVVVIGDLSIVCGISAYGVAVWDSSTSSWNQLNYGPAATVVGPDAFGASAHVGTSKEYARADHDHGLPSGGSGGPASLSGPGETASPGALTQAGGMTINDSAGNGILLESTGVSAGYGIELMDSSSYGILLKETDSGAGITLHNTGGGAASVGILNDSGTGGITLQASAGGITIEGPGTSKTIQIFNGKITVAGSSDQLGFFGQTPATRIAGSTITTLAQLVTALQTYGLLS